jgi:hypothetical protein
VRASNSKLCKQAIQSFLNAAMNAALNLVPALQTASSMHY